MHIVKYKGHVTRCFLLFRLYWCQIWWVFFLYFFTT